MRKLYLAGVAVALATVVAMVVAVVAFSGGGGAGAGDTSATASDGTTEGITVHGHWVIEVREPDGALASRNEFDNALHYFGPQALARLLTREASMGMWRIALLQDPLDDHLCVMQSGTPRLCEIWEPDDTNTGADDTYTFMNLAVSRSTSLVQLSGYAVPTADGAITGVVSTMLLCSSTQGAGVCSPPIWDRGFSKTDLPSAIEVLAGQQVLVTVTFTFS